MKKKILFLTNTAHISGAENVVLTLIKALACQYEVAYVTLGDGDIISYLKDNHITHYNMKKNTSHYLNKIIDHFHPDIIHANDFKASLLLAFSKYHGKKISHIHQCPTFIETKNLKSLIYKLSIKKYDSVISVSTYFIKKSIFQKDLKGKYVVIPNIIDCDKIARCCVNKTQITYDFAYFGRLENDKNPLSFIEIVKKYKDCSNSNIRCIMVGDGSLRGACQAKIKEYELEDNIDILGFLVNPFSEIQKAKLVIMPSKNEGFGLTAVESMYLGKPVICSGVGGLKEIFRDHLQLTCSSDEDYIKAIKNIFKHYEKYQAIAKEIASHYVDVNHWANQFKTIYDN